MISLFRKYTPLNFLLLVLSGIVLCLGAFIQLPANLSPVFFEPALSNLIGNAEPGFISPVANVLLTLILTLVQAVIFNKIVNDYNLFGKPGFLPALMYITLASLLSPFLVLSPVLICNFLLIWMIDKFLSMHRQTEVKPLMFDLGMIVATGTLFYFPFILMFLLLWIGLLIFRPFNWREWIAGLMGFITIYFILGIAYFWFDKVDEFYSIWLPLTHPFPSSLNIDLYDYLVVLPLLLIIIFFINTLRQNFYKSVVHIRKSFQLFFFMLLFGLLSFYLEDNLEAYHFLLCVPPLAVYIAYYFNYAQVKWLYESLYLILVICIIYFQFF
ncbi:hypothetical protein SAMN05216436_10464 [bacterium A37T11]|nr:hypothetical protein SAMN05216436_10464 [bacterium A37T11]